MVKKMSVSINQLRPLKVSYSYTSQNDIIDVILYFIFLMTRFLMEALPNQFVEKLCPYIN
jgi:hypothetical protein